jgi:hypothetical protein
MIKLLIKLSVSTATLLFFCTSAQSQFTLNAQLRTRTEFRDGQGAPLSKGLNPAVFTSQRTRLNALFTSYRLKMGVSVQDVRVWGQDVSTINRTTAQDYNGLMLHEAWAEIRLTDTVVKQQSVNLKIGRQELVYDDQRLIGNLDWLQQGRRHDAVVLKYENKKWMVHLGGAFNQNKENSSGTSYNSVPPGNYTSSTNGGSMYKSMEFLYAGVKLNRGTASFLFFSDQFNTYHMGSVNNTPQKIYTEGTWLRATTGVYLATGYKKLDFTASAYYQFGENSVGKNVKGQLLSLATQFNLGKISVGPGVDFTSPDFDPLYGTPHKFWGLMDYFYAASSSGTNGLVDYYLKSKWKASERISVNADVHHFSSASKITGFSKQYGQEVDLVGSYNLTKLINIECGYAHFFSTKTLTSSQVKNVTNPRAGANWAYVMINIKPEFLFK